MRRGGRSTAQSARAITRDQGLTRTFIRVRGQTAIETTNTIRGPREVGAMGVRRARLCMVHNRAMIRHDAGAATYQVER